MARAKKCEEEFNPWPPFVDVFSSVILVLLLFILVTIVNVAYYMQFNAKSNSVAETAAKKESLQAGKDVDDSVSFAKVKQAADTAGRASLFSGGTSQGNAVSVVSADAKETVQNANIGKGELLISYEDKEVFITDKIRADITAFIKKEKKKNIHAKFHISVAQPTKVLGSTVPKQISLGRALNVKNLMKKLHVKLSDMKLKMTNRTDEKHDFGYVKIKVIK